LTESWQGVDLGEVLCLENDSPDPDTAGNEDGETPQPGEAFFYLARFNTAVGKDPTEGPRGIGIAGSPCRRHGPATANRMGPSSAMRSTAQAT
jgi:hypothetical protein